MCELGNPNSHYKGVLFGLSQFVVCFEFFFFLLEVFGEMGQKLPHFYF